MMACYRSLRARRPELAQAQILQIVFTELKRAKRTDEEERLYRESIDGATQIGQIAGVFGLAAERGDVDGPALACDRYERLQSGRGQQYYYTGSFYFQGPAPAIEQCMTLRADSKAHDDVLRILDHELAASRRRHERQSPGSSRLETSAGRAGRPTYIPDVQRRPDAPAFRSHSRPPTNTWTIRRSRSAHRIRAFQARRPDERPGQPLPPAGGRGQDPRGRDYPRLALASVLWWNDDKDEAIAEFTKVAEASKPESDLRLDLAELLEQQGERALALAMTESVQPLDNTRMKRREELALRLSVLTGDLDRARQAAERLFGLRLDTDTQVRLAGQMHQLGLHELAEAVLGRARRRAGNKASALVGMMVQYQRQGQLDVAVQVAMQILRSTNSVRPTNHDVYLRATARWTPTARPPSACWRGRAGCPSSSSATQEQLKKTPRSIQLHQTLADYYQASGQREKATAELASMIALRPDDNGLAAPGRAAARAGKPGRRGRRALQGDAPERAGRRFLATSTRFKTFQQAGKTEELLTLLEQMDFRQFGQPAYVFNMISNLSNDKAFRGRAASFMKKAWEAFPDDRSQLLQMLPRLELWQLPEMEGYLREALIPNPATFQPLTQWNTMFQILSYSSGRPDDFDRPR